MSMSNRAPNRQRNLNREFPALQSLIDQPQSNHKFVARQAVAPCTVDQVPYLFQRLRRQSAPLPDVPNDKIEDSFGSSTARFFVGTAKHRLGWIPEQVKTSIRSPYSFVPSSLPLRNLVSPSFPVPLVMFVWMFLEKVAPPSLGDSSLVILVDVDAMWLAECMSHWAATLALTTTLVSVM